MLSVRGDCDHLCVVCLTVFLAAQARAYADNTDAARHMERQAQMRIQVRAEKEIVKKRTRAQDSNDAVSKALAGTRGRAAEYAGHVRETRNVCRWKDFKSSTVQPDPDLRRRKREATLLSEWRAVVQEERDRIHDLRTSRLEAYADAQVAAREKTPLPTKSCLDVDGVEIFTEQMRASLPTLDTPLSESQLFSDLPLSRTGTLYHSQPEIPEPFSANNGALQAPPSMMSAARVFGVSGLRVSDAAPGGAPFGTSQSRRPSWLK